MTSPSDEVLAEARAAPVGAATARRVVPLIQLDGRGVEDEPTVRALCDRAMGRRVAALRLLPQAIQVARSRLGTAPVCLVGVARDSGDDLARTAAEVKTNVDAGADEVEVTAPTQAILDGDVGLMGEQVEACRAVASGRPLAVVLDVGALGEPALVAAAARAAIMAGAERLVVAGEPESPPSLEATAVVLAVLDEADGRVGLGVAGADDMRRAASHLRLIERTMGADWVTPTTVRLVSSALLEAALAAGAGAGSPDG